MKKFISFVTSLTVAATAIAPALTSAASDFLVYADYLAGKSVIKKTDEAGYRLGDKITRAEMAKVAANLAHLELKAVDGKVFGDVTDKLGDLAQYIEAMASAGYVAKNANFRPMDLVTRAEMVKMLLKAKGVQPSDEAQGFADIANIGDLASYVNAAAKAGIISKNANFRPNDTASRGEVFKVAAKADGFVEEDDLGLGDLFGTGTTSTGTTSTGTVVTPTAAGDLTVALNPASPSNGTQVPMAGIVRFAQVDFKASSSDISLASVELKKAGLSTVSSSTKAWFEKNGLRLSGKSSFTSEGNVVVSFAPAFVVKAGTTETLDLYVQLNDTVSGTDYQFVSGQILSSAKNLAGAFSTPVLRTANYSVATFQASRASSGADYKASNDVVELGAFKIAATKPAGVTETRDEKLQSITLFQSGSAQLTNLSNLVLYRNGVAVSTAAVVDGKSVTFAIGDIIKDGATATYYVKANIINVENQTDSYQLYLKNTSDLNIIEATSGFRANADLLFTNPDNAQTGDAASKFVSNLYTVNGGDVKFERDTAASLSATYAPGTSNVVLMQGMITAKNAVTLEDPALVLGTLSTGNLSDYFTTLYLTVGSSVFSVTATGTGGSTLTFNGTATVTGTAPVKLYGTLKSTTNLANATIKFSDMTLASFTGTKQYVVNQNNVTSAVGSIPGITVSVANTTLNVTRNDSLGNTTLAAGSKGVTVYGVQLSSTQGNPINVTSASFNFTGTGAFVNNAYATLYVDGAAVTSKTIDTSSNAIKFDGISATVSSTKSVNLVVKVDFQDSFGAGTFQTTLATLAAVDSVSSKDLTPGSLPAGAQFTIASADAVLAVSDLNPLAQLYLANSLNNKLFAFKMTAKNDNVNFKTVSLTGTGLGAFSNYKLFDSAGNKVADSSTESSTGITFDNILAANSTVAMDKSVSFYVAADAKSNTDVAGVQLNLNGTGSVVIRGTNGLEVSPTSTFAIASNAHAVAQNTAVIAKASNPSKEITTSALRFTVAASGKNSIALRTLALNANVSGYFTTGAVVNVYKDSVGSANLAFTGTVGTVGANVPLTLTANNKNTVDAGSSATYIVTVEGVIGGVPSVTPDWNVSLTNVGLDTNSDTVVDVQAASYNNVGQFPITEVK